MAILELSDFQRANLEKLARYLWDLPQAAFSMHTFSQSGYMPELHECGTVGCAVGNGPLAGIKVVPGETWNDYHARALGSDCEHGGVYCWCFHGRWVIADNTPRGAAKRILYMLRRGVPASWNKQQCRIVPLCYLNEPLDLIEPKREPLAGVVELVKAAV